MPCNGFSRFRGIPDRAKAQKRGRAQNFKRERHTRTDSTRPTRSTARFFAPSRLVIGSAVFSEGRNAERLTRRIFRGSPRRGSEARNGSRTRHTLGGLARSPQAALYILFTHTGTRSRTHAHTHTLTCTREVCRKICRESVGSFL